MATYSRKKNLEEQSTHQDGDTEDKMELLYDGRGNLSQKNWETLRGW